LIIFIAIATNRKNSDRSTYRVVFVIIGFYRSSSDVV